MAAGEAQDTPKQVLDYPVDLGGPPGDRTRDTLIKSQVLYH